MPALATVTMVGYGDVRPMSAAGRILARSLAFVGLGLLGFASACLTAPWLQPQWQVAEEAAASCAAIMGQLESLRTDVASLHRSLVLHDPPQGQRGELAVNARRGRLVDSRDESEHEIPGAAESTGDRWDRRE